MAFLKIFAILFVTLAMSWAQPQITYGEVEVPAVLSYNSPLRQPDSLKSRPYFDFLSTLYRRDTDKTNLFRPYANRNRRDIAANPEVDVAHKRNTRAILFRPLFVYRQQQVRRQKIQDERRRHRH